MQGWPAPAEIMCMCACTWDLVPVFSENSGFASCIKTEGRVSVPTGGTHRG